MCSVGLLSQKTPFQLQADRICSVQKLAEEKTGRADKIAWYIVTSASTVKPASDFLAEHDYFGLEAKNVFTLQQGTRPLFTLEDEMILGEEGVLNDMKVKYIQPHCVDDPPVRVGHPVSMDHRLAKTAECAIANERQCSSTSTHPAPHRP